MGEREGPVAVPVVPVASVSAPHIYSGNTRTCTHDLSTTAVEAGCSIGATDILSSTNVLITTSEQLNITNPRGGVKTITKTAN